MNIGRACPWVLAGWLLISVSPAFAGTRLPDSTFQDWSGELSQADLPDGSVLFEYTSRTFSGRVEGAMLALSFIPRFDCAPTFTVRLRGDLTSAVSEPLLEVSFGDDERLEFPGFVDNLEGFLVYSISASGGDMNTLRRLLDVSPRATIAIHSGTSNKSDTQRDENAADPRADAAVDGVVFSLLGSRLATLSAQTHCMMHEPVAFQPR